MRGCSRPRGYPSGMVAVKSHPLDSVIRNLATNYTVSPVRTILLLSGTPLLDLSRRAGRKRVHQRGWGTSGRGEEEEECAVDVIRYIRPGAVRVARYECRNTQAVVIFNLEFSANATQSSLHGPFPRSPSHHVWHRSYSPCNCSVTVALPFPPPLFSLALLLLSFPPFQNLRRLSHRLLYSTPSTRFSTLALPP